MGSGLILARGSAWPGAWATFFPMAPAECEGLSGLRRWTSYPGSTGNESMNRGHHEHEGRAVATFCSTRGGGDSPESVGTGGAFDGGRCGMEAALHGEQRQRGDFLQW
jgi:hypothetical protein